MPDTPYSERIIELANKWMHGTITEQEKVEFSTWYRGFNDEEYVLTGTDTPAQIKADIFRQLDQKINLHTGQQPVYQLRKHSFNRAWLKYAASIVLILAACSYLWLKSSTNEKTVEKAALAGATSIPPGKSGATLTLADGTMIMLENVADGLVKSENGLDILLRDGQLSYHSKAKGNATLNTLFTAKGRQFRILLPDGSVAWLNAASSITYPTAFTGKERLVSITGEVYFQISKNAARPFKVNVNEQLQIEVLGTDFNVNAYTNEPAIRASLVNGAIKINHTVMRPGEAWTNGKISGTDVDNDIAWKNGMFAFDGANIQTLMRQIERWYDIEVRYEGPVEHKKFKGKLQRNLNLAQILKILDVSNIRYEMDGHILTIK